MQETLQIGAVIARQRRALGLTQQELSVKLGVSYQAVSKWENHLACPDVGILPVLARTLHVDLNELFDFQTEISEEELGKFLVELSALIQKEGMEKGFAAADAKMKEYPGCGKLIHRSAMVLEGSLLMAGAYGQERERQMERIYSLYGQVLACGDERAKQGAAYMLASWYMHRGEYGRAEEMLSVIPKFDGMDKRPMEANLLIEQERYAEAGEILERKLLNDANSLQMTLTRIMELNLLEEDEKSAEHIAGTIQELAELLGLWECSAYAFTLENVLARKDEAESISILEKLFEAFLKPWDPGKSPLYRHITSWGRTEDFGKRALPALLAAVRHDEKFAFLRGNAKLSALLEKYSSYVDGLQGGLN